MLAMPSGCWNRFWPWIHRERSISPMHTLFYHMELYFGAIRMKITQRVFSKFKKFIRIITNSSSRDRCRQLFKHLQILSLPSQYIFSLLVFVIKNRNFFQSNSEIYNLNTRYNRNLHLPSTKLTSVQKGVLFSGSKIYNHLPSIIKALSNDAKRFKSALKIISLNILSIVWTNFINQHPDCYSSPFVTPLLHNC